ncbi:MAG: ribonuclease H-like domain-containing protein [Polyangiaceae bacterium]|nr:ribonuclease H-like domain-containing protein [Polyangiaceae bacterium]
MDLTRRLSLLGPGRPAPAAAPGERQATLDELRAKMAAIVGRPPVERELPDPETTLLPFVRRDTEHGPLCIRRERLGRSHHVGRMCVDEAARADPRLLALLALDPSLASVDPTRALYLDTETTGLGGGAGVLAFLVGMAWFDDDGGLVMEQLLLQRPGEEDALLELFRERVERASVLVSYNGKSFDLPLLRGRFVMNRRAPLPPRPHLDLLHVARRLHKRRLGACRLIGLEADVLGYVRVGDIEGGDVAARYAHYLRSGDEGALAAVVEHNALDVLSMAALVGLYGEPFEALHDEDLIGLAEVLRRAKALDQAQRVADRAVERAFDPAALRVRGEIAKARGDRAAALLDFEAFTRDVDDPAVRLELAKLYEHHVKSPEKALELLELGTGESAEASGRRRARLEKKRARRR